MKTKQQKKITQPPKKQFYQDGQCISFKLNGDDSNHFGVIEFYYDGLYSVYSKGYRYQLTETDIIVRYLSLEELNKAIFHCSRDEEQEIYSEHFHQAIENEGFNRATANLIAYEAYEKGHSAGYSEVVGVSIGICSFVKEILQANTK